MHLQYDEPRSKRDTLPVEVEKLTAEQDAERRSKEDQGKEFQQLQSFEYQEALYERVREEYKNLEEWSDKFDRRSIGYFNQGMEHIIRQVVGRIPLEEMAQWHLRLFSGLDMRNNVDQIPFTKEELALIRSRDEEEG